MVGLAIKNTHNEYVIKFPKVIGFETTTSYVQSIGELKKKKNLTFDLSETHMVHSSFVGFLLDIKRSMEKKSGNLVLLLSPELTKLFKTLDLYEFLTGSQG